MIATKGKNARSPRVANRFDRCGSRVLFSSLGLKTAVVIDARESKNITAPKNADNSIITSKSCSDHPLALADFSSAAETTAAIVVSAKSLRMPKVNERKPRTLRDLVG